MHEPSTVPAEPRLAVRARRLQRVLVDVIGLVLVVELIGLSWPTPEVHPFVEWLGPLAQCLPALLCWSAVPTAGARRLEVTVMAVALSLYGAGTIVFVIAAHRDGTSAFPSVADLGFLAFYPLALTAIVIAARRELYSAGLSVWLDSLLGGLGAATVLSLVLDRVFIQATGGSLAGGLALIYPVLDLLLVSAVIGIVALQGRRLGRTWLALLAGFAVLAGVDALAALPFADGSYAAGGPADLLWPIGLALIGPWACAPSADPGSSTEPVRSDQPVALVLPAIATVALLAVLVASVRGQVSTVTLVLAILTLVATAGRTQIAFRQLVRLNDLRQQASTDELTAAAQPRGRSTSWPVRG